MAHVVALDPLRRAVEPERLRELAERGVGLATVGEPTDPLLRERVLGVTRRELREVALLAPLRHEQPDRTGAPFAREHNEPPGVRDRRRDDDLRRHGRGGRVVLAEEGPEHVGRRGALGALEREVVPAHDRAVAHAEHLDDRVPFRDRRGEDVEVVAFVRVHLLAVQGPLDRGEPVAQRGRALERERVRGLLHLFACVARERLVASLEEEHALVDRRAVVVLRRVPHAGRGAAPEVEQQARAAAG